MVKPKVAKSKFAKRYPKEFQRQMVELHRAGTPVAEAVWADGLGDQTMDQAGQSRRGSR